MNVWKIIAPGRMVKTEEAVPCREEGKIKVRVTKVYVNETDAALHAGTIKAAYPHVPGRFAVGLVSESDNAHLPKGARVLLHTFCPAPDLGTAKKDFSEDDYFVHGQNIRGFLRDFVIVSESQVTRLPDAVSDERALIAHHAAIAKEAIDCIGAKKGEHIAVVGGSLIGMLICQLLIYYQASPILIDNRADRLEFARRSGVYYTMTAGEDLLDKIATITGGRFAAHAIYATCAGADKKLPFRICAARGNVAICGFWNEDLTLNFEPMLKKQLTVHGISCMTELEPALNLLANKAIDLSEFHTDVIPAETCARQFASFSQRCKKDPGALSVISFI